VANTFAGLSLRDLEYAVAVAQTRHFGRAAQLCAVSQPALSEQIHKLEALLGVTLFERGRRQVQVTARGATLLRQAEKVLSEAHGLLDVARDAVEPLCGTLLLGAIQTLGPYYLPFLLRQARESYPRLALRLMEGQTDALIAALRAGTVDAVLVAEPVPADGLASASLFFEPFQLVCPVGHRLAGLPRLRLPDLVADDLILLEEGHCLREQALSLCQGAAPQARHATSVETLWHMIAAGEGFSLLPALSVVGRQVFGELVSVRELPEQEAGRTIALVWRRTNPRAAEFLLLADLLRGETPAAVSRRA